MTRTDAGPQAGSPLRWENLSWRQIADLKAAGMDLVILPVGATEQHGPHLPTGVDTFSAQAVGTASRRTGIPVLPAIAYGCSLGHSRAWRAHFPCGRKTLARMVFEIADWVRASGFTRLVLLNGHVTNWAPLRCALENIRADLPEMRIALRSVWDLSPEVTRLYEYDGGATGTPMTPKPR